MSAIKLLLCIFLPPVAVYMVAGFGLHFILNIILFLMGGIPGIIHALWLNMK